MSTQRMFEIETFSDEEAACICQALSAAYDALAQASRAGMGLAYWQGRDTCRFAALADLADGEAKPLLHLDAARALAEVIGDWVPGGYPHPEVVDLIGSYGSSRPVNEGEDAPHAR